MGFGPSAIADRLDLTMRNFSKMPAMLLVENDYDDLPKFLDSPVRTIAKH
jgi:hypothetical protein